jgi:BirA family biotin operon repressor/biotin-[acetyl-CoA-carboxylase] ligase
VRFAPSTGSTNADVLDLAASGAPGWTVIVAGHQEAGRGRLGRSWEEPPGSSLLVSVLLPAPADPAILPLASLAAAVAMADALRDACGVDARCKWPNDLMARGRKLGGILAEARVQAGRPDHLVVGTGVNVLQRAEDLPRTVRDTATSVSLEGGRPDAAGLLSAYLAGLRGLHRPADPGFPAAVLARYRPVCETIGMRVHGVGSDGRTIEGLATGVGDAGELIVDVGGAPVAITFGEVVHVGPAQRG